MSVCFRQRAAAVLVAAVLVAACGGSDATRDASPASAPVKPAGVPVDPATVGTITGTITLQGTPPSPQRLKTASDPNCVEAVVEESYVVGKAGALQNVFVYVKDGLGNYVFDAPSGPVVLEQRNCTFRPHVLGVRVGQQVELLNSDETLHNIHSMPRTDNEEFNVAQATKGARQPVTFTTAEVLMPFKCDVHNWMNAYVGVVDHPYFAVTGADGRFELKGVPPGTYTIEAVHERLGRQTQTVTIASRDSKDAAFTFAMRASAE